MALSSSFATELWQGFTTDMDYKQTIEKIEEKFGIKKIHNQDVKFITKFPDGEMIYSDSTYSSHNGYFCEIEKNGIHAIIVYFFNNKLYSIGIFYFADKDVLYKRFSENYGKPKAFTYYDYLLEENITLNYWEKNNVISILRVQHISYTDIVTRKKIIDEANAKRTERAREEAKEKEKNNNSILF